MARAATAAGCRSRGPATPHRTRSDRATRSPGCRSHDDWASLSVAAERADPHSTLAFYRTALAARTAQLAEGWDDDIAWLDLGADVLAFRRGPVTVVVNCGDDAIELPGGDVVVATEDLDGSLPANAGVWLR